MNFVDAHAPSQLIENVGTDILKNKKLRFTLQEIKANIDML